MAIIQNYVLVVAISAWFVAQVSKTLVHYITTGRFSAERLVGAGGMPSCHSATVSALLIAMVKKTSIQSPEFAIVFILFIIVVHDAMGVRRAAGEHARLLNRMMQERSDDEEIDEDEDDDIAGLDKPLKEFLGHTPMQVLAGCLLGILVAMMFPVY